MTLPSSTSHDTSAPATTSTNEPQGARTSRPQPFAWGTSGQQQSGRRGLTPISTAFGSAPNRPSASSSPSRNSFSPVSTNFPSAPPASTNRQIASRTSSASSNSSPFSPAQPGSQQLQSHQLLLSARSRTIASSSNAPLASSGAALPAATQGGGGGTSSGGGGGISRLARASPSISQSAAGSPASATTPSAQTSGQSLSKIVIAQVFVLLSTIKEDKDKAKWESQAEQIQKARLLLSALWFF